MEQNQAALKSIGRCYIAVHRCQSCELPAKKAAICRNIVVNPSAKPRCKQTAQDDKSHLIVHCLITASVFECSFLRFFKKTVNFCWLHLLPDLTFKNPKFLLHIFNVMTLLNSIRNHVVQTD